MNGLDRPVASAEQIEEIRLAYNARRKWIVLAIILPFHFCTLPAKPSFRGQALILGILLVLWAVIIGYLHDKAWWIVLAFVYILAVVPIGLIYAIEAVGEALLYNQDLKTELYLERGVFEP